MKAGIRRIGHLILKVFYVVFVFGALLITLSIRWGLSTWQNLKMDEMIFELTAPLEGTGDGFIGEYILNAPFPAFIITVILILMIRFAAKRGRNARRIRLLTFIISAALLAVSVGIFWVRLDVGSYIRGQSEGSLFIEEEYADPHETEITFPEKKRNLIYIYLESFENTFADEDHGGAFPENLLPNLTELAEENESFAGDSATLNGAVSLPGSTWTMGAIFAETAGLPLKIGLDPNGMSTMDEFFPDLMTLGDILEEQGYRQTFLLGSDASFGGRRLYFTEHGNYSFEDYVWAKENGNIPEDYKVFWGYEDEKLFEFAKESLQEMAATGEPFNYTILTVDTHFEDGYICDRCEDEYPDNQYATVFRCSDRQVSAFVRWIREQEFYENTTIVISGDHPTMDSDFCNEVPSDYQRTVYTTYINAAPVKNVSEGKRLYSTFDDFPTTLAALGARIEGERLGIGTNLFSGEETLTERFGLEYETAELNKKSVFLEKLEKTDLTSALSRSRRGLLPKADVYPDRTEDSDGVSFKITNFLYLDEPLEKLYMTFTDPEEGHELRCDAVLRGDGDYLVTTALSKEEVLHNTAVLTGVGASGEEYTLASRNGHLELFAKGSLTAYLNALKEERDCAVFLLVADEAATNLTEENRAALAELGLVHHPGVRESYIGVIENNRVLYDQNSSERIREQGTLENDVSWEAVSCGYNGGRQASLIIDGETVLNLTTRGLHIVVYDEITKTAVDRTLFDTYVGEPDCSLRLKNRSLIFHKLKFTVSDLRGDTSPDSAGKHYIQTMILEIWDEEYPEEKQTLVMDAAKKKDSGEVTKFSAEADSRAYEGKTIWLRAVGTNDKGQMFEFKKVRVEL